MNFNLVNRVLIVTAHPDDECMFFAPIILNLTRNNKEVHLLCLSNGNSYGEGITRTDELKRSCNRLKIKSVQIINDVDLQDSMKNFWPIEKIILLVQNIIDKLLIKTIITFDNQGVSGHRNHVSIYSSMQKLKEISDVDIYTLKSFHILRKYCIIFDIISNYCDKKLKSEVNVWSTFGQFIESVQAMFNHKSQLTWYRYLYIFTSCYMIHNKLLKL